MKKSIPMILAAATAMTFAVHAQATITVHTQVIPLNPANADTATLAANGWEALKVYLVADGSAQGSTGVVSWDFAEAVSGFTSTSVGTPGISGPMLQVWTDTADSTPQSSTTGTITAAPGGLPQSTTQTSAAGKIDSFFAKYPAGYAFTDGTSPNEDNNFALTSTNNLISDNYQAAPAALAGDLGNGDGNGNSVGVGSLMTWAGAIKPTAGATSSSVLKAAPLSVDLAYIIVPINADGKNNVTIYGDILDDKGNNFVVNQVLNPGSVSTTPEPASIGLIGLGAAGLLARRKNKR